MMKTRPFTAVLLAAGMGSRLGELTKDRPKPLLPLRGKTLLAHGIEWCKRLGASKIVVVGGYRIDQLRAECAKVDTEVVVVENKDYASTQRMVSLVCAHGEIEGGLYVRDADYFFDLSVSDATRQGFDGMTVFGCRADQTGIGLDMRARVSPEGFLLDMGKELSEWNYYFCTQLFVEETLVPAFLSIGKALIAQAGHGRIHVEDAVLEHIRHGRKVRFVDLGEPRWAEIDTPEEYAAALRLVS
jgi:choline kinase